MPEESIKEEAAVKKLMKKIDDIMVAITFAEAGEYEMLDSRYSGDLMGSEAAEVACESA